jgi:hypothetical protein
VVKTGPYFKFLGRTIEIRASNREISEIWSVSRLRKFGKVDPLSINRRFTKLCKLVGTILILF